MIPGDADYDEVRAVYNGMIDRRPAAIAQCRDAFDVSSAVRFAREHGIEIAVRGGGHNAAGLGVWDGALVIDLSADARRARSTRRAGRCGSRAAPPGATSTTRPSASGSPPRAGSCPPPASRASPSAAASGYLTRRYGLTVDNLIEADVILADGSPRDRQRGREPRPVLGPARRWRQLRRGDVVRVPLPPGRRAGHRHRRSGALRPGRHRRGDAVVPRAAPVAARGAQRLDRAAHDPAGAAVPRGAVGAQGLRHRVVLHRSPRPGRRGAGRRARASATRS